MWWWLCVVFDVQKVKSQLKSALQQLYAKAVTVLMSPEALAEHSSLTLETARSHKMVRCTVLPACFQVNLGEMYCSTSVIPGEPGWDVLFYQRVSSWNLVYQLHLVSFFLRLFWACASSQDRPTLHMLITPSHHVFLRCPLSLIASLSVIIHLMQSLSSFLFHISKPSQPTIFNHQTDWFQVQQFSEFCAFVSFWQNKSTMCRTSI